jgi:hypothetical protein
MRFSKSLALWALTFILIGAFGAAYPQLQAQSNDKVVCDADLIRSWYIAEYYFGFNNIVLMAEDLANAEANLAMIDLTQFEQGQFAPLFAMLADTRSTENTMIDESMVAEALLMTEEELDAMTESMLPATSTVTSDMVLFSPVIENDPVECQALRAELRHFYSALLYTDVMMSGGE